MLKCSIISSLITFLIVVSSFYLTLMILTRDECYTSIIIDITYKNEKKKFLKENINIKIYEEVKNKAKQNLIMTKLT